MIILIISRMAKTFYRAILFLCFKMMSTQVVLNEGTVVGAEEKLPNGNLCYSYKGIPYAEPPIGNLRFEV